MTNSSEQLNPLTFPLNGSRLIEASAGTGKTFTLALLYLRLVLGHGDDKTAFRAPLTPRDLLVVTFTDAAAEELRDRIRERLVEAADYFHQRTPQKNADDPLELLRTSYAETEWNLCAWKLQVAAESMDEAQVSTIHSWCNRVLVEQAFDTRGLFNRQLVTETQDLLAEVVRDYWRIHFYSLSEAEAGLILDTLKSPAGLLSSLSDLLKASNQGVTYKGEPLQVADLRPHLQAHLEYQEAKAEADQNFAESAQERLNLEAEVKAHWRDNWQDIQAHLLELRTSLSSRSHKSGSEEDFQKLLAAIYAWAAEEGEQPSLLKNFAAGSFKFLKNKDFNQENPLEAFTLLKAHLDASQPAKPATEEPELSLNAAVLAHALPWVQEQFNQRMKQRAEMGFDDLLIELDKALNPKLAPDSAEHLAANLRSRFPVAMIDEFQDTDPIQYRIFDQIYAVEDNNPETGLFMIGDPKQAIYSFRGADIHTYLQARKATAGRHFTLKKNFRSTQGVVEACNTLFKHAEQHPRAAFRFQRSDDNPLPFVEVEAQGREEALYLPGSDQTSEAVSPLIFWHFPPEEEDDKGKPKPLAMTRYRELAAHSTASQISEWLIAAAQNKAGFGTGGQIQQSLKPADIAILVRTGTEAKAIRKALQERQIASVYLSDRESLFSSQEAQDLLHWLHACANPLDERLVKAALGTNSLAIPLERLAHWQVDELAWEEQMQHFQRLHWTWQRQGVLVMLSQLLQVFDLPARLMQHPEGERSLTNLLHLAEWLQQASSELDGEQALIRHLADYLETGDQQQLLRLESDAERVKVITIHKSKGLEYPLVLLPFIGSWREIDGRTRQVPYPLEDGHYLEIADKDSFKQAWDSANDERISEDMRLLYVALTRARHALWLGVAALKSGNAKKPQVERSALGYLLNAGKPVADAAAYEELLKELVSKSRQLTLQDAPPLHLKTAPTEAPEQLDSARPAPELRHLSNWWIASYSAIHFQSQAGGAPVETTDTESPAEGVIPEVTSEPETAKDEQTEEESRRASEGRDLENQEPRDAHQGPITAENVLHRFPAGATWGTVLHTLMEWAAVQEYTPAEGPKIKGFAAVVPENQESFQGFSRFCSRRRIQEELVDPLWEWLINFLSTPWKLDSLGQGQGFALRDLKPAQLAVELEFMIESHWVNAPSMDKKVRAQTLNQVERPVAKNNLLNGLLKGFIDLVAEHEGRYYVIDWKSNRLGRQTEDYTEEAMLKQLLSHRYDLQYVLYLVALHRLLKARLPNYDYDQHIGGAVYVFLRGTQHPHTQGLFCDKPPKSLIEELDALFAPKEKEQEQQGATL